MKRFLSLVLCLVLGLGCMTLASAAAPTEAEAAPAPQRLAYISHTQTLIGISGGKATCMLNQSINTTWPFQDAITKP